MKKKRKMTIKEYAEKENIDLTRYFVGENLRMSMQTYYKRSGLPGAAKLFRILNNEKI